VDSLWTVSFLTRRGGGAAQDWHLRLATDESESNIFMINISSG